MFSCKTHQEVARETARNPRGKKQRPVELEDPACERRIKCKRKLEGVSRCPQEQNGYTVTFMKV